MLQTLQLFSEWGQAATLHGLAANLLGGGMDPEALRARLDGMDGVVSYDGVVGLKGHEGLLAKTERRHRAHSSLAPEYRAIAEDFAQDLTRWCPFIQCIAITGSLASGGFEEGDDIDFDLFVASGTKYLSYLMAILLGMRYSWQHRHREVDPYHQTPLLPKITCVNVVWAEDETRPFIRRDRAMAFELLRCEPLLGTARFREVLQDNPWLSEHFPQLFHREWRKRVRVEARNLWGNFLDAVARWPRVLRLLERLSRRIAWVLYHFVQEARKRNSAAARRQRFLKRVKYPYEVFQD